MNTDDKTILSGRHCATCGAELPANVTADRCPKCLLKLGLETAAAETMAMPPTRGRPNASPQAGEQFGHYRIVRLLGEGGMGAVYEAEDTENGRRVALKVLSHSLDSPEARRRFFREGRLAASVNHPNSVYVFGTEEIAGTPVIAMELVLGGTLQQRVAERGPLPVGEAVDGILQAIAGLEAAQRIGILHRDIKPSNCFVDADGAVKIGDFGLSLSTAVRTESDLTVEGAYLGTPAFSAPEQLRGDELTVRSDIYAVGVTLYYLLTGKIPFEAEHMVQLLAMVLEKRAKSPAEHRREIPKGLCQAVLRCLEKDPSSRFRGYAELRAALLPYASAAPTPATLGRRALAGALDYGLLATLSGAVGMAAMMSSGGGLMVGQGSPLQPVYIVVSYLLWVLYYALPEGLRGASLGKWICGVRVTGRDRNVPRLPKALLRASLYVLVLLLPLWVASGFDPSKFADPAKAGLMIGMGFIYYLVLALLFCTMRRRNGFAAIHDLLTKTRVIGKPAYRARPVLAVSEEAAKVTEALPSVGPYHVLETLEKTDVGEWLLAYDGRLLRKVWVHVVPAGTPPVGAQGRAIGRIGRLRWITGRRSEEENWDAFEGVTGKPLVNLLDKPQPWSLVRYWLLDLATEMAAAEEDGTVPAVLDLDRVWITGDGRAKLFDFRAPAAVASAGSPPLNATGFLNLVVCAALGGGENLGVPLPVHARKFVEVLSTLPTAETVLGALKPLLRKLAVVTRARRAVLVAGCLAVPVLMASFSAVSMRIVDRWQRRQPELTELSQLLTQRKAMRMGVWPEGLGKVDDRTFAVYIASHYRSAIGDPAVWHSNYANMMVAGENRLFAERSLADHPNPTAKGIEDATATLEQHLPSAETKAVQNRMQRAAWYPFVMAGGLLYVFVCIPAVIAALLFRGGLVMRICGVAVVRKDGRTASRGRVFWRSVVAWSPVLLAPVLLALLVPLLATLRASHEPNPVAAEQVPPAVSAAELTGTDDAQAAETTFTATDAPATPAARPPAEVADEISKSVSAVMLGWGSLVALLVIGLTAWSLALPDRSLQDRIAGTCLVPR